MDNPTAAAKPAGETARMVIHKAKRTPLIIGGVIALIVLLAGAAFVGGQLLREGDKPQAAQVSPHKLVTPAAGIPSSQPDAQGDVQNIGDSSFFVCAPITDRSLSISPDGGVNGNSDCGSETEVVIGRDTIFYHDVTSKQYVGTPVPDQDLVLQQKVEPGSAHDIAVNTTMAVWGTRSGNRVLASILVYWVRPTRPAP